MISFLTSPKPFIGKIKAIQLNSIYSWQNFFPECEIIFYGNSEGTGIIAQRLNIKHIPNITTNEYGTPLFNAIAKHAKKDAKYELQVYINCDIILSPNFINTLNRISFGQFLMIGQRIDLKEDVIWEPNANDWYKQLLRLAAAQKLSLHPPSGSDYFSFKRGLWDDLPPVIIGRGGYDNALIKHAISQHIPVIDATLAVKAIHQFHDYAHMPKGREDVFSGEEALINLGYAGNHGVPSLTDSTWYIDGKGIKRNYSRGDWMRFLECYSRFVIRNNFLGFIFRQLRRVLLRIGLSKQKVVSLQDILQANL